MALAPMPEWPPLPDPPGPDPALAQDFQLLAAGDMAPIEAAANQLGAELVTTQAARAASEAGVEQLGREIASGAVELEGMSNEAAADNLVEHLDRAGQQDDALLVIAGEAATALGDEQPAPEPQPAPPPPAPPTPGDQLATGWTRFFP